MAFFCLVLFVGVVFYLYRSNLNTPKFEDELKWVARHLVWQYIPKVGDVGAIEGTLEVGPEGEHPLYCRIDRHSSGSGSSRRYSIHFQVRVPIHNGLKVTSEGVGSSLMKFVSGEDIEVGDEAFDRKAYVEGPNQLSAVSYLNTHVQRCLLKLFDTYHQVTLEDGYVTLSIASMYIPPVQIYNVLDDCKALAGALLLGGKRPVQRMVYHINHDPEPHYRSKCLALLCEHMSGEPEVTEACLEALKNDMVEVRLVASQFAPKEEGFPVVLQVANDTQETPHIRKVAMLLLSDDHYTEREALSACFSAALDDDAPEVVAAAVEGLMDLDELPGVDWLQTQLVRPDRLSHRDFIRCLRFFPPTRYPQIEETLCGVLGDEDEELAVAALEVLGKVGTVASLEAVVPMTTGVLRSSDVKQAAREAVASIQSRIKGEAGGLSVSAQETDEGQLSLSHGGELSIK